jgi:hypothetical protein
VVQETTSDRGDPAGSANPARSKVKKPGASAEMSGPPAHVRPRAARPSTWVDRTRPPATAVPDGWSPPERPQGRRGQNPAYRPAPPLQAADLRKGDQHTVVVPLSRVNLSTAAYRRGRAFEGQQVVKRRSTGERCLRGRRVASGLCSATAEKLLRARDPRSSLTEVRERGAGLADAPGPALAQPNTPWQ